MRFALEIEIPILTCTKMTRRHQDNTIDIKIHLKRNAQNKHNTKQRCRSRKVNIILLNTYKNETNV